MAWEDDSVEEIDIIDDVERRHRCLQYKWSFGREMKNKTITRCKYRWNSIKFVNCDFSKVRIVDNDFLWFESCILEDCVFPKRFKDWQFPDTKIIQHGMEW